MGKLWTLYQEWRDGMEFPPSHRQIAARIGISSSTIAGWRDGLAELPKRSTIWRLHEVTNIPFEALMQAAIEDAQLFDPKVAEQAALERASRKGESEGRRRRKEIDDADPA